MDFNDIKQLINSQGERIIFVENGKPTVVLLSFYDYKKISLNNNYSSKDKNEERGVIGRQAEIPEDEFINNEQNEVYSPTIEEERQRVNEVEELKKELKRELTLEDLPF